MRIATIAALLVALAQPSLAQLSKESTAGGGGTAPAAPAAPVSPFGTPPIEIIRALPQDLGGYATTGETTDYEARPDGRGLGASANYRPAGRPGLATLYVYDGTRNPRRATPTVEELRNQFNISINEITRAGQRNNYRVVTNVAAAPIPGPDGRTAMACRRLVMQFNSGSASESYLCIGITGVRFLKLRMTIPLEASAAGAGDGVKTGPGSQTVSGPGRWQDQVLAVGTAAVAALRQTGT